MLTTTGVASAVERAHIPIDVPREFLAFSMGQEEYGLDILKVQEIRGYEAVTRIANAPDFLKGVINLRGVIVPLVDMRIMLKLGEPSYDASTIVIVLSIGGSTVGMVVDGVSDVIALRGAEIRPAPAIGSAVDTGYLIGIGTVAERMVILVDIDKLMAGPELGFAGALAS